MRIGAFLMLMPIMDGLRTFFAEAPSSFSRHAWGCIKRGLLSNGAVLALRIKSLYNTNHE